MVSVIAAAVAAAVWSSAPVLGAPADAEVAAVPLASALAAPVPVDIGIGRVALLDVSPYRVTVVATSDPGVAHAVVHDTAVLLIALRPGVTTVGVGLGGRRVASFLVRVTDRDSGIRAVRLETAAASPHAAAVPASPRPAAAQAPSGPGPATPAESQAAARSTAVGAFVSALTNPQRAALAAYLRAPSLGGLAALLRALTPPQQAAFMRLVAGGSGEMASAVGAGPVARQAAEQPHGQAAGTPIRASDPAGTAAAPAGVRVSAPEGVRLTVVPTWTGPVLSLSYVLQNDTGHTLRADPNAIAVSGAAGDITVRQLDLGEAGVVPSGGVETGVIVLTEASFREVDVRWQLGSDDRTVQVIVIVLQQGSY
jgi:hypothetical protein